MKLKKKDHKVFSVIKTISRMSKRKYKEILKSSTNISRKACNE